MALNEMRKSGTIARLRPHGQCGAVARGIERGVTKLTAQIEPFASKLSGEKTRGNASPQSRRAVMGGGERVLVGRDRVWHKPPLSTLGAWDKDRPLGPLDHLVM